MPDDQLFAVGATVGALLKVGIATDEEREAFGRLRAGEGTRADVLTLEPAAVVARLSWRTLYPRVYARALPTPGATPAIKDIKR